MITRHRLLIGLLIILAGFTLVAAVTAVTQPRIDVGNGRGWWDGQIYGEVADSFAHGSKPVSLAPWVYRIGTPFLAASLSTLSGVTVDQAFLIVNLLAAFLATVLLYFYISQFVNPLFAAFGVLLFVLAWSGPLRFGGFFLPVHVDPWFWVFWIVGLIVISKSWISSWRGALVLGALTFIGVLFRETVLMLPVILFLSCGLIQRVVSRLIDFTLGLRLPIRQISSQDWPTLVVSICAFVCGGFGLLLSHSLVIKTANIWSWSYGSAAWDSFISFFVSYQLPREILAVFVAYGPILVLLWVARRAVLRHLRQQPIHPVILFVVLVVSIIGGTDFMRFLYWAAPVVLLLLAIALEDIITRIRRSADGIRKWQAYGVVCLTFVAQLVSSRVFWPNNSVIVPALMNRYWALRGQDNAIFFFVFPVVAIFLLLPMFRFVLRQGYEDGGTERVD